MFVAPSAGVGSGYNGLTADWSLQSSSPCVNAGDTTGVSNLLPALDLAGNPRINGIIDMGGYELPVSQGGFMLEGVVRYDNTGETSCEGVRVFRCSGVQVLDSTMSNAVGAFMFTNVAPGTYTLRFSSQQPWGGVNAADAMLIMKHFVGINSLSELRLLAAELNDDDAVNSVDALLALKRFVGMTSSFAVGDWQFEEIQVPVQSNTQVNIKGICSGDTDGSYTP